MKSTAKYFPFVVLAALFIWVGMVGAISFMEAPLKFNAPGITIPLGLGIGRIVFGVLNKLEWVCGFIVLISVFVYAKDATFTRFFLVPIVILILQTVWLLPVLDKRAQVYIDGGIPDPSMLHTLYIVLEVIKWVVLIIGGVLLIKQTAAKIHDHGPDQAQ